MKILYLLLCLACSITAAFAQQKAEFGFVVKAGNFSMPDKFSDFQASNQGGHWQVNTQNMGTCFTFGLKESLRLNRHFRVSGELLYRLTSSSAKQSTSWRIFNILNETANYIHTQQSYETSLSLPIKLHFSFLKDGSTSVALGAGISKILRTYLTGKDQFTDFGQTVPHASHNYPTYILDKNKFKAMWTVTAGIYQRINKFTTLGLEFVQEQRSQEQLFLASDVGIDIVDYSLLYFPVPKMQSFSITLSHVLTRPKSASH